MNNFYREPSIDVSYQVSVHLAKRFRGEGFQKSINQKQELPLVAMFVNESGRHEQSLYRTFHRCFLPSFGSFGHAVSEKIFRNRPIRNKNCLFRPCLLTDRDEMNNLYRGPYIDASQQVTLHLAMQFQRRRIFRNRPIRNKNCLWRPCLLTDRDEMNNLYRGPYIDASYQVTVHLALQFQRRFFRNRPIRNKNCLDLTQILPTKFQFIWLRGFREND